VEELMESSHYLQEFPESSYEKERNLKYMKEPTRWRYTFSLRSLAPSRFRGSKKYLILKSGKSKFSQFLYPLTLFHGK